MAIRSSAGEPITSLYLSYKKSTNHAMDWLFANVKISQGQHVYRAQLSTGDIIKAALLAKNQNLQVPAKVLSELKEAIRKRRKIHDIYVAQEQKGTNENQDISHQKFIERLEQAFEILSSLGIKQPHGQPSRTDDPRKLSSPVISSNRYSALADVNIADSTTGMDAETPMQDTKEESILSDTSSPADSRNIFIDDHLSKDIELCLLVYHLDSIYATVNEYWTEVAAGRLPMVMAAYLTSIAYRGAKRIISDFSDLVPCHESILTKWNSTFRLSKITFIGMPEFQSEYRRFSDGRQLDLYWHIFQDYRKLSKHDRALLNNQGNRQNPKEYICPPHNDCKSVDLDRKALETINANMLELIDSKRAIAAFETKPMSSVPLLFEVREAVKNENAAVPTALIFGTELLLSTYKVYSWPNGSFNTINCRIATLQFTNNVLSCTKECMPYLKNLCQCQTCFICWQANRMYDFQHQLETYLQEKRFDLFAQAPWSAASHMIEILHASMFESITLCCRNNYVVAVLHLYNALLKVNPRMQRVLWLDQVCQLFTKFLFPGSLPQANFGSVFRLSTGGRLLKTSDSRSENKYQFSRGSLESFERRVDLCQLSIFYALHNNEYRLHPDLWAQIYRGELIEQSTIQQKYEVMKEVHSTTFTVSLDKIKDATLSEFQGELPITQINFFGIFKACIEILEELPMHFNAEGGNKNPQTGFHVAGWVLDEASQHPPPSELIEMAARPFETLDSLCSVKDFSWETPRIEVEIVYYYIAR